MSPSADPRAVFGSMWRTRPPRRQSDRMIAGVAAAIARRYDIDPVLLRIGFVVAAFYGIGILLYLLAWVALPPDPRDPPAGPLAGGEGRSAHPVVLVAVVVASALALGSLARGNPGVPLGLAVVAGLLYLLHENRGERGERGLPATGAAPTGTTPTETTPTATVVDGDFDEPTTERARHDLDTPGPDRPAPPRRPRSVLSSLTVALALLAGGLTGAITLLAGGDHVVRLVAGVMLAVVGLGLVVGAFWRRGHWLLLAALPLLAISYGATRTGSIDLHRSGDLLLAPTSASQLAPSYRRGWGTVTLDLTRLDLSAPAVPAASGVRAGPALAPPPATGSAQPVRTRIRLGTGQITVLLPPDADVTVHCHADLGTVHCLGPSTRHGPDVDARATDLGQDGKPGGRPVDLDLTVGAGDIQVNRD